MKRFFFYFFICLFFYLFVFRPFPVQAGCGFNGYSCGGSCSCDAGYTGTCSCVNYYGYCIAWAYCQPNPTSPPAPSSPPACPAPDCGGLTYPDCNPATAVCIQNSPPFCNNDRWACTGTNGTCTTWSSWSACYAAPECVQTKYCIDGTADPQAQACTSAPGCGGGSGPTSTPVPTTPPVATPTPGGAPIIMYNCRTDVDPNPNDSYTCLATSSTYDNNAAGIAQCQANLATYVVNPYPGGAQMSTGICYNTQSACRSGCCRSIYWCQNDGTCAQTANNYYSNDGPGNPGYLDCNNNFNTTCTQNLQALVAGGYIAPLNNYACYSTQASCQASCFPPTPIPTNTPTNTPTPTLTLTPTVTLTPTPTATPIPGAWKKLKDTTFISTTNLDNNIPAVPVAYDSEDSGQAYFIINNGGITNSGGVVVAPSVSVNG